MPGFMTCCVYIKLHLHKSLHICMLKNLKYSTSVVLLKSSKVPKFYLVSCRLVSSHGSAQVFQDAEEIQDSRLK